MPPATKSIAAALGASRARSWAVPQGYTGPAMKTQHPQGSPKKSGVGRDPTDMFTPLLSTLRQPITDSRQQVLRAVDVVQVQVQTYWHIGQHILEFEQGGVQRAAFEQRLLSQLGQACRLSLGGVLMAPICGTCGGSIKRFQFATHCVAN